MSDKSVQRKLVIVGDPASGKTALLVAYMKRAFLTEHIPTVFENYNTAIQVGKQSMELALYDTGGSEEYDRLRPLSYPDTDVVLITFSIDNTASYENIKERWLPEVHHFSPSIPIILVALKKDLRDTKTVITTHSMEQHPPITYKEGKTLADEINAHAFLECSPKTGEGVDDVFMTAGRLALLRKKKKALKEFSRSFYSERMAEEGAQGPEPSKFDSKDIEQALQRGLLGGKKTVCRNRLVLIGHFGAGKTSLKRSLLKEDFVEEHIETDSIEADPSKAKVDITRTKEWQIHKVQHEFAEFMTTFIVDQVTKTDRRKHPKQKRSPKKKATRAPPEIIPSEEVKNITEDAEKKLKESQHDVDQIIVELFIWDFGGQSVYYNTHMTFLTRQSIYALVLDMTKKLFDEIPTMRKQQDGTEIPDTSCPQTVADYVDYWCSCINTFVPPEECREGGVDGQAATPAIVIVCTHRDKCSDDEAKAYVKTIQKYIADKPYFNHIHRDIFMMSNKERNEDEIQALKDRIVSLAKTQSYDLPVTWVKFKEEITKPAPSSSPRKSWREAKEIARHVGLTEEEDVVGALSLFHQIGDLVFFNENTLRDFIITDPQWMIEQFRKVITIPKYREHFGRDSDKLWRILNESGILHPTLMKNVWSDDVKEELTALMKKFSLLCEISSQQLTTLGLDYEGIAAGDAEYTLYLVPSLIASDDQDQPEKGLVPPVFLIPSAKFIPIGLNSRLIAGLINEDCWQLVRVSKDAATFLPTAKNSVVDVRIRATKSRLEVSGMELDEEITGCDFSGCLDTVCNRLKAITSTVCPQQSFSVSIQCLECKEKGKDVMISLQPNKQQLSESVYCRGHGKLWKALDYSRWFQAAAEGTSHPGTRGAACQGPESELYKMAKSIKVELKKDRPRLVGPTGFGVLAGQVQFAAYLRTLSILQEDNIQKIEAKDTRNGKAAALLDFLLPCSKVQLIKFAWVLVTLQQDHQLPMSITDSVKTTLKKYNRDELCEIIEAVKSGQATKLSHSEKKCYLM